MSVRVLFLGGLVLAGGLAGPAMAQDAEAGREIAGMCRTCHGLDGYARIPIAPHIGGEPADYLAEQLRAFRSGAREHEMMSVVAASLSDTQIEDVSAWYAAHVPIAAEVDADAAPELCSACHGADGIALIDGAPNLTGEPNIYLETQLKAFRSGKRENDIMTPIAEGLSDAEIRAVSNWYAGVELEIVPPEG